MWVFAEGLGIALVRFLLDAGLRSGQDWQERLWQVIPENDVFYLFWSRDAAKSNWVQAEWKCALASRGAEFIDPVPLCGPDAAPPPEELAAKHFDDWTPAFGRQAKPPRVSLFARLFGAR